MSKPTWCHTTMREKKICSVENKPYIRMKRLHTAYKIQLSAFWCRQHQNRLPYRSKERKSHNQEVFIVSSEGWGQLFRACLTSALSTSVTRRDDWYCSLQLFWFINTTWGMNPIKQRTAISSGLSWSKPRQNFCLGIWAFPLSQHT